MIGELVANSYQEPERVLLEKNACLHSIRSAAGSRRSFTFQAHKAVSIPMLRSQPVSTAIGTGPMDIEVGDMIYIPDGSKVPLIIRAVEHSTGRTSILESRSSLKHEKRTLDAQGDQANSMCSEVHNLHRLVGGAYVHGFMDGETSSDPRCYRKTSVYLC